MAQNDQVNNLLEKVEKITKEKKLDLSSGEDLSIGIMNLISIEEHLFFTAQKTGKQKYLDLLNEVRLMRTELLKQIVKDYEGEVWCISKHLLAASMRLIEVGTKELKKTAGAEPAEAEKQKAWDLFDKAYKLYSLFWGINLGVIKVPEVSKVSSLDFARDKQVPQASANKEIKFINEKLEEKGKVSVFDKLGEIVKKAIDCCKE